MKQLLLSALFLFALSATTSGHILDEYLQATQIALAPDGVRVELRLTPGVEFAHRVFTLIDLDHNGQISPAEEQAYAQRVLADITLDLDHRLLPVTLASVSFPSRGQMKTGDAAILLTLWAQASLTAPGDHQLTFRNNHLPNLAVYQANALVPTDTIKITAQQRDRQQREFQLQFRISPRDPAVSPPTQSRWPLWVMLVVTTLNLIIGIGI
jgi:nickel/cobalt transporter (NicO) family protein